MTETMATLLVSYYPGVSFESARELVAELEDTKSLQSNADHRVARAVTTSTPPLDLEGLQ